MAKSEEPVQEKRHITTEELRRHSSPRDLWISIQGKVYDVTQWAKEHPGGALPLQNLAGQDATNAFVAYHPGTVWQLLDRFYVGQYADYAVSPVSQDYRRMVAEIAKLGLFDKKGHTTGITLCAMAVLLSLSVYGVLRSDSFWVHLGCAVLMGCLWVQSGWIGHDSGHHPVMPARWLDRVTGVLVGNCLTGVSIGWWKHNHNAHHIACNSLDNDPDVQHLPIFAVSAKQFGSITSYFYGRVLPFNAASRLLVSYQHWTFYPVMCVARVNLFAQSVVLLLSTSKPTVARHRIRELFGILVFWTWFPLLVSCLPTWSERILFVLLSFSVTGIQHVQFCLNHFSSDIYVGPPTGNDWFEKQTAGTLNLSCPPWMDWFHGGLQFQVEHHLFPRLPRCHLRRVAPLVRELCRKHGLSYSVASFWEANAMTIRTLRTAAMQARSLVAAGKPAPKNLVWEAVNTHG